MKQMTALMIVALFVCGMVRADVVKVAFGADRPPYAYIENGVEKGIEVDVMQAVLSRMGDEMHSVSVPNIRLLLALKTGSVDVATLVQGHDGDGVYFSDDYMSFHNAAISKEVKHLSIESLRDIDKYSFVIWQGGWHDLGPEFEATYKPVDGVFRSNYHQPNSQDLQSMMFWANRVDVIIVDRVIFEYYRKQLRKQFNTDEAVAYHEIFGPSTSFSVAFRDKAKRDQFNAALRKLRADGSYQRILDRYK